MPKTLSESAAEILQASLASAGREPPSGGRVPAVDLGGQTPESDPTDIGAVAASVVGVSPKPGETVEPPVANKKTPKVVEDEEEEEEEEEEDLEEEIQLTEKELEEFLASLTEEELEEFYNSLNEENDEGSEEDTTEESDDIEEDVEDVVEETDETAEKKEAIKEMVDSNMGSCKEDILALFNGEDLSEDFKTKATTIFEAAVRLRVEAIVEKISEENEVALDESLAETEAEMVENIDKYLSDVVSEWLAENQLAVETGLRAEIAEDFMTGLRNLFVEHYIDVPEEKADLVEELAARVAEFEEKLTEQTEKNKDLTKKLNESKSNEIVRKICEGLTEVQMEKIRSLAEGVEFTSEGEYEEKLAVIRESYFPTGKIRKEPPTGIVETSSDREHGDVMDYYVKSITKQLPKFN